MRRRVATFVAAALLLSSAVGQVAAGGGSPATSDPADPTGRWIVLYTGGTDAAAATQSRSVRIGFHADRTFTHGVRGFSAALSASQKNTARAS